MARFNDNDGYEVSSSNRQRDVVLASNEFCAVQSRTNGVIKVYTGPITITISGQETMVIFNPYTKRFEETNDFNVAKQLFTSAPEGWYVVLKNPAKDGTHPEPAKAVNSPELIIGKKVNIAGPCSFSLYPGQMAKVIQGHRLRSNQYLIARVYDADAAQKSVATIVDADGKEVNANTEKYFVGQLLVIKGTEVSFYMPPTGIEVLAVGNEDKKSRGNETYIREAITLERLEYAILKDEDGEKRYIHGPAVVFPKPTETFVQTPKGGNIFRALELSPISGIYVKVIADYTDDDGTIHKTGEELFITGKDQMIYYPRPEHAMIQYDGKYMHHAIAIPNGEGRYVLDRLNGEIKTIYGPAMYLPDPRTEVVVKRKLTRSECELFYPGNTEVLNYNLGLSEKAVEKMAARGITGSSAVNDMLNTCYSTSNQLDSLAIFEANANISRGVSYTKPRTITLDTKYDGVVSVDVWAGYAINVVSKSGKRDIVVGPTTRLLDYDETIAAITLSTGKPKNDNNTIQTAFLRTDNNKVSDLIAVQTSDYVDSQIRLSYNVSFLPEHRDKWFTVENYVKFLTDYMRSVLKRVAKKYTINEFYSNSTSIIREAVLGEDGTGHLFEENGMFVNDVEIIGVAVETEIAKVLNNHRYDVVSKSIELADAENQAKTNEALAEMARKEAMLESENKMYKLALSQKYQEEELASKEAISLKKRAIEEAETVAKRDLQAMLNEINLATIERENQKKQAEIENAKKLAEIEATKQKAYADMIEQIVTSASPDLVAALTTVANGELLKEATKNMSPYAIAEGASVSDVVNKLMRGTSLESVINNMSLKK